MDNAVVTIPIEKIQQGIYVIRGRKVMLDRDLARMYGVTTKRLNEQVKRNRQRFPEDFMFQLTDLETGGLRSQFATSRSAHGGQRYNPYVFTEHGAVMLAAILSSATAIHASIQVVRAFVQLREMLAGHKALARKIADLERKYDAQFAVVYRVLEGLREPPTEPPRKRIGFHVEETAGGYRLRRTRRRT